MRETEPHESMGVHVPMWCATCSEGNNWVPWPCPLETRRPARRWAVATALMSVVSIVNIMLAAIVDPLMARMFCASAAWAAGAMTMFCLSQGVEVDRG